MNTFIEINHISPISRFKFNNKNASYKLVFYSISNNNKPLISIVDIKNINNITDTVRGYTVKKAIKINAFSGKNTLIKLFRLEKNILSLLFSDKLEHDHIEFNHKYIIEMTGVPTSGGKLRNTVLNDKSDYLCEKFFNYEINTTDKCLLSIMKVLKPQIPQIKRFMIKNINNGYLVFDRDNDVFIKETIPSYVAKRLSNGNIHEGHINIFTSYYCENNPKRESKDPGKEFITDYQIDLNIYKNLDHRNRVKLGFRPKKYEPYLNSIVTAPVDSRIKPYKGGFKCRVTPQDYKYIHVPYAGKLLGVQKNKNITIFRFGTNFFKPLEVKERDYPALITGNYIHHGVGVGMGSRYYPELMTVQPKTRLEYSLIVEGDIIMTNNKLINQGLGSNFDQGDELCKFKCRGGNVNCVFNRPIDLTNDIKIAEKYDVKIKLNDIVCILK